MGMSVCM